MRKILSLIALINIGLPSFCQQPTYDQLIDILPPAPNAASIIKYGNATVARNTGTPEIGIPLFTVKGNKLSQAVSLNYSSNGIKVDEIASRVGMGWTLNSGGVITRTLRGKADELHTRHYPYAPIGFNWSTYMYMQRIATSTEAVGGYDSEPDLFNFSFGGYSGSFILGAGFEPMQVNKAPVKIEKNFTSPDWTFKITADNGTQYFFGGDNAKEKTKRLQLCGKSYESYITTSWYLKEIVATNGEKIVFTYNPLTYEYDNGVSQTMYNAGLNISQCACGALPTRTCINEARTQGVLLQKIEAPGKSSLEFSYITRDDCTDKLLSALVFKDPVNTVGSFTFQYSTILSSPGYNNQSYLGNNKTPYLASLIENSASSSLHRKHYFSYIDPGQRPSRLSYSQDHWGYFNGKANTTLTPKDNAVPAQFPAADADREPDFDYAKKGLLEKIVYPTGGITKLFYEPNSTNQNAVTFNTMHNLSCDVKGTGDWAEVVKTYNFSTSMNWTAKLFIECIDNTNSSPPYNHHNVGRVTVKKINTGGSYTNVFDELMVPNTSYTRTAYLTTPGTYQLVLSAAGTLVTTKAKLEYSPETNTSPDTKRIVGGARVAKIVNSDISSPSTIKKYFYGPMDDLNTSSLYSVFTPRYKGISKRNVPCTIPEGGSYVCPNNTLSSSSVFQLGHYNGNIISYQAVTESNGENFEGGGTEYKYMVGNDALGVILVNNDIINAPFTNFSSFYNGKLLQETNFRKNTLGAFIPVKKTEYSYLNDQANEEVYPGYTISRAYSEQSGTAFDTTCNINVNCGTFGSCCTFLGMQLSAFDMIRFDIFSSWVYPQTKKVTDYDETGQSELAVQTTSFYENNEHYQLTKTLETNSIGKNVKTTYKYPHDYNSIPIYAEMISKNIITPIINVKTEKSVGTAAPVPQIEQQTDYSNTGNNNYMPVTVKKAISGSLLETEGTIDFYDDDGNILQYTPRNGLVTSIIWGYNKKYAVAKIVGAAYADATAALTMPVTSLQTLDGAQLLSELNNIRTALPTAQVTTYTYKHLVGITSITDPRGRVSNYTYDDFSRLKHITDHEGKVVKANDYQYTQPDPSATIPVYYNAEISQGFACATCSPGFTGTTISYTVPAGRYFSLVSQAEADIQANLDLQVNGQDNANKKGICSNTLSCTGVGYKFVNCYCELGTIVCESSAQNANGEWVNVMHYQWSDGSIGNTFTVVAPCTGNDKKQIGCICETGQKICESTTNNNNGTYSNYFHYKWSDNSVSTQYSEIVTCTGIDKKMINCECRTGVKVYISTEQCTTPPQPGCCTGQWLCTFRYLWNDGTLSDPYTECSPEPCYGD